MKTTFKAPLMKTTAENTVRDVEGKQSKYSKNEQRFLKGLERTTENIKDNQKRSYICITGLS